MISEETLAEIQRGLHVKGSISKGLKDSLATFNKYRKTRTRRTASRLLKRLEHGWMKELKDDITVYEKFPKLWGTAKMLSVMDREHKEMKDALIDRELDLITFM
jgi:hypothetical protein